MEDGIEEVVLPKRVLANLFLDALNHDPKECCGVLVGQKNEVQYSRQIQNVHPKDKESNYTMDATQVMEAEDSASKHRLRVIGYYHSHTFTEAYPSTTDTNNAVKSGYTEPFYVVISTKNKLRPIVRAFKISDKQVVQELNITTP